MAIKIRAFLRPFSHQPGSKLLIPKSPWKAVAFPTRLEVSDLTSEDTTSVIIEFNMEGPIKLFTAIQDLERSSIRISGQSKEGFFSYRLFVKENNLFFYVERCQKEGLPFSLNGCAQLLNRKESLLLLRSNTSFGLKSTEKIHFGCFKKQDWELMKRRLSLAELLPHWFQLGNGLSNRETAPVEGEKNPFVRQCRKLIQDRNRLEIGPCLIYFFQSHFEGIFCPRNRDSDYQGFKMVRSDQPLTNSPLELLSIGALLIRSLFVRFNDNRLTLLPCLPKELHAGRFIGVRVTQDLMADIEWSKKMLKRVILRPEKDFRLQLCLQKDLRFFRLSSGSKQQGKKLSIQETLYLERGKHYLIDRLIK